MCPSVLDMFVPAGMEPFAFVAHVALQLVIVFASFPLPLFSRGH